jgi:hypothetical protein
MEKADPPTDSRWYGKPEIRKDYWARRWLEDKRLKWPKKFLDLNDHQNPRLCFRLRRGAGVIFDEIKGVIIRRRDRILNVKTENDLVYKIFLPAARRDYSAYRKIVEHWYVRRLDKITGRNPQVKRLIEKLKRLRLQNISETDFNICLHSELMKTKLNKKWRNFIRYYFDALQKIQPILKSYDGT